MQCRALETGLCLSDLTNLRPYHHLLLLVFCCLAKLIQLKSATLQRFQLAFKHLLLLEKNSRLHPFFQDFAFNFHTFSRSGKVVSKFPDFFKNSRLCTNPVVMCPSPDLRHGGLTVTCLQATHYSHCLYPSLSINGYQKNCCEVYMK